MILIDTICRGRRHEHPCDKENKEIRELYCKHYQMYQYFHTNREQLSKFKQTDPAESPRIEVQSYHIRIRGPPATSCSCATMKSPTAAAPSPKMGPKGTSKLRTSISAGPAERHNFTTRGKCEQLCLDCPGIQTLAHTVNDLHKQTVSLITSCYLAGMDPVPKGDEL